MVDTEHVLEQMRVANPAPSLEQLADDDLDLVRDIVARERSATTTSMTEPPQARPDRMIPRRALRPVLVAGLTFILVLGILGASLLLFRGVDETATAGFACPPGSNPDQPGPASQQRLPGYGPMTFDPGSGRVLMLAGEDLWMFDVCANVWALAPGPEGIGGFVYDVDSGRAIVFDSEEEGVARVWAYEPDGQTWTEMSRFAVGPPPEWFFPSFPQFQAAYDPVTGLVVVREIFTSQMWTYDVDTDTWTEVDQGPIRPPALENDGPNEELLTYDASVDRLILYVGAYDIGPVAGTWEFDIRAGRWEEQQTNTPDSTGGFGWWPQSHEIVYDEANEVSVLFSGEYLATYNASENSWTVIPYEIDTVGGLAESIVYDPVNERILVAGRFAYDVATGEWITLLEPTTE